MSAPGRDEPVKSKSMIRKTDHDNANKTEHNNSQILRRSDPGRSRNKLSRGTEANCPARRSDPERSVACCCYANRTNPGEAQAAGGQMLQILEREFAGRRGTVP